MAMVAQHCECTNATELYPLKLLILCEFHLNKQRRLRQPQLKLELRSCNIPALAKKRGAAFGLGGGHSHNLTARHWRIPERWAGLEGQLTQAPAGCRTLRLVVGHVLQAPPPTIDCDALCKIPKTLLTGLGFWSQVSKGSLNLRSPWSFHLSLFTPFHRSKVPAFDISLSEIRMCLITLWYALLPAAFFFPRGM